MLTVEKHSRWAVTCEKGLVCKNTGNDWRTGLPGYSFTRFAHHAKLYATKSAATKCAGYVGGEVIEVRLEGIE